MGLFGKKDDKKGQVQNYNFSNKLFPISKPYGYSPQHVEEAINGYTNVIENQKVAISKLKEEVAFYKKQYDMLEVEYKNLQLQLNFVSVPSMNDIQEDYIQGKFKEKFQQSKAPNTDKDPFGDYNEERNASQILDDSYSAPQKSKISMIEEESKNDAAEENNATEENNYDEDSDEEPDEEKKEKPKKISFSFKRKTVKQEPEPEEEDDEENYSSSEEDESEYEEESDYSEEDYDSSEEESDSSEEEYEDSNDEEYESQDEEEEYDESESYEDDSDYSDEEDSDNDEESEHNESNNSSNNSSEEPVDENDPSMEFLKNFGF